MAQIKGIPTLPVEPPTALIAAPELLQFPDLPTEIRLKIWSLAANSQPDTFDLQWISTEYEYRDVQHKIPSVLLTCRESHFEGLRYYTLCYERTDTCIRGLYINFGIDQFKYAINKMKRMAHRAAFPPAGSFNFDKIVLQNVQNVEYEVGAFTKPLKTLLEVLEPESEAFVILKGRVHSAEHMRQQRLLHLHIKLSHTYMRQLPHATFEYHAQGGNVYTLTGDPLVVRRFLQTQTSF